MAHIKLEDTVKQSITDLWSELLDMFINDLKVG